MNICGDKDYIAMIVDDEPFVREDLKRLLARYPCIRVGWETGTLDEARTILVEHTLDILFLDLCLRGGSGFDLVSCVDVDKTALVFVTAHEELAGKAGSYPDADLLLKPVEGRALDRALGRGISRIRAPIRTRS